MSTPVYSKKHLAALVAAILVLSSSLAVYSFQGTGTAYGSYYDLGLSLTPEGSVKLGVAEPQEFTATVSGGDYPYTFTWTSQVHYKDNKTSSPLEIKRETFTQEWTEKYFANEKPISKWTFDGFPYATEDYFTVMVEVTDVSGAKQSEMCFVFDPYTSPTQYLNGANLAAFDYKIETDGLGWYRAVSGKDGSVFRTSTNSTDLQDTVLDSITSGTVVLNQVAFDLALMNSIPANVQVVCSYGDEQYTYINSADTLGSTYTVSVGAGVNNGYYLAADSGNRICWSSTDAAYVINTAIAATTNYGIVTTTGSITTNSPIIISGNAITVNIGGVLNYNGNDYAVRFDGSSVSNRQYSTVNFNYINLGASAKGGVIFYNNTYYCKLNGGLITASTLNASQVGIAFTAETSGVYWNTVSNVIVRTIGIGVLFNSEGAEKANSNILQNVIVRNPYSYGIKIESGYGQTVSGGKIETNVYNNVVGVYCNDNSSSFQGIGFELIGSASHAFVFDTESAYNTVLGGDYNVYGKNIVDDGYENAAYASKFDRVNKMKDIIASTGGWGSAPSSLASVTDGDFSTASTEGYTNNVAAYGTIGYLVFDMGSQQNVLLTVKVGTWSNASAITAQWQYSNDGTNYYYVSQQSIFGRGATSEYVQFGQVEFVQARFVKLIFLAGSAAMDGHVKVYEVQAITYP